ncbi:MAG: FAD/NAD(P)-binding protein, partial [Caulobacteraceae bacterium]
MKTVAVVGGGFSGALFALKLHRIAPRKFRILVIERGRRIGRGVAYGACSPDHFLNVPVSRMEVGLTPRFGAWLRGLRSTSDTLRAFVAEGPGDLQSAFIPRELFGDYMEERFAEALTVRPGPGIAAVRGEAVGLLETPRRGLRLRDGRAIEADRIVLAMGNLPPRRPGEPDDWIYDTEHFIPDPWAADALADVRSNHSVLLLGAGLTMVDIALKLSAGGREGSMLAISRRGLLPHIHRGGGEWPRYVKSALPTSPRSLTRLIREQVAAAEQCGIPWQRVFDAARPAIPAVWNSWDLSAKRQFLRHLRRHWDVHRHRMA